MFAQLSPRERMCSLGDRLQILLINRLMIKSRREIQMKKRQEKYRAMMADVQDGMSFRDIARKYKYKSEQSARTTYYLYVLPRAEYFIN